jgi:hypothetical protein
MISAEESYRIAFRYKWQEKWQNVGFWYSEEIYMNKHILFLFNFYPKIKTNNTAPVEAYT